VAPFPGVATMSSSQSRASGLVDSRSDREFQLWHRSSVRRIAAGFASLAVVIVFGVLGFMSHGWRFFEAFYMVVITISGVGFGEVRPLVSTSLQIHTILVIALGMVSVAYTLAGFVQFLTEGEIRNYLGHQRMRRQIDAMVGHTIIAGYGRVGTLVGEELTGAGIPFVVVERSIERVIEVERKGYANIHADATEEDSLRQAGLERAKTLVSVLPTDAENVFLTLTARRIAPNVEIIARAEQPVTLKTLRQAGADHVVMPAAIGAHRIVSLLTNPSAVEFAELVTRRSSLAIEMEEIPVKPGGPLDGLSLRDADIGRRTGVMVIAVKRADGRVEFPPSGDEPFAAGDSAVILGRRSNLNLFKQNFQA
jgi:voltage-gated potassium channel